MFKSPFVIAEIQTFIDPMFDVIVDEEDWQRNWNNQINMWSNDM